MRGKRNFDQLIKGDNLGNTDRRGRNEKLIKMRNECLLARYFYYGFYKNMCYEEILKELVVEFFLSRPRIIDILMANDEALQAIRKRGGVIYYFQHKWPHLKW